MTARFGATRRRRGERIVRPGMLGIAAPQVGPNILIAAAPEARQIARHLNRTVRRRQQLDQQAARARRQWPGDARGRTAPARGSRASGPPPRHSRSEHCEPDGAVKCVGASASSRLRKFHGSNASSAAARSSAPICDSAVLPSRNGASQSRSVARQRIVRQVGPFVAFGRAQKIRRDRAIAVAPCSMAACAMPSAAMPSASSCALSASGATGSVCSAKISAPSRRMRRARNDAEAASNVTSSRSSICPAKRARSRQA